MKSSCLTTYHLNFYTFLHILVTCCWFLAGQDEDKAGLALKSMERIFSFIIRGFITPFDGEINDLRTSRCSSLFWFPGKTSKSCGVDGEGKHGQPDQ